MIDLSTLPLSLTLPVAFLGGLIGGYGYFRALHETTKLIFREGQPFLAVALTLGRVSVLITGFFVAVLAGGLALLAALAGLLCAKTLLLRRIRKDTL